MPIFSILDGRKAFWQWDVGQRLIVADEACCEVHYCNGTTECALRRPVFEENGVRLVDVPDVLLQHDKPLKVFMRVHEDPEEYTNDFEVFAVKARTKPDDYVYTPEERKTWEALQQEITALSEELAKVKEEAASLVKDAIDKTKQELIKPSNTYASDDSTWSSNAILKRLGLATSDNSVKKQYVEIAKPAPYSNLIFSSLVLEKQGDKEFALHVCEDVNLLSANNADYSTEPVTSRGLTTVKCSNETGYYVSGTLTSTSAIITYGDLTLSAGKHTFKCYKPNDTVLGKNCYYQLYRMNGDAIGGQIVTKVGYDKDYHYFTLTEETKVRVRIYVDGGITIPDDTLFRAIIISGHYGMKDKVYNIGKPQKRGDTQYYDITYVAKASSAWNNKYVYMFPYPEHSWSLSVDYVQDIVAAVRQLQDAIISLGGNV